MLKYNVGATSGTFDTITATSYVGGPAVFIGNVYQKVKNLSALVTTLAETNTITLTAVWQVSNDKTTWVNLFQAQNPANVALGTGTAGADTAVTKVIDAPPGVYGWQWARLAFLVGVTTGAVGDTYAIGYSYRAFTGAEGQM